MLKGGRLQAESLFVSVSSSIREVLSTPNMAKSLGISNKMLLRLRKIEGGPFQEGRDYRFAGMTKAAPVQWFPNETDQAFSNWERIDPNSIETMEGAQ